MTKTNPEKYKEIYTALDSLFEKIADAQDKTFGKTPIEVTYTQINHISAIVQMEQYVGPRVVSNCIDNYLARRWILKVTSLGIEQDMNVALRKIEEEKEMRKREEEREKDILDAQIKE